jgi:hypothetical protein
MNRILKFLPLCFALLTHAEIPSTNRIDWIPGVTVGVLGGIPARSTIYSNVTAGASVETVNGALATCPSNQVVKLGAGSYTFASAIAIPSGVTLRGSGSDCIITTSAGFTMSASPSWSATNTLVSGYQKGSSNIVTTMPVAAGRFIVLSQRDDTNVVYSVDDVGNHHNFLHVVADSSNGTNLTIWPPVPFSLSDNLSPHYRTNTASLVTRAGIEDLVIIPSGDFTYGVQMSGASGCWVKGITVTNLLGQSAAYLYNTVFCEIREMDVRGSASEGDGYGVQFDWDSEFRIGGTGLLVEDNVFDGLYVGVIFSGAVGCAVSFNYSTNEHSNTGVAWGTAAFNAAHGAGGLMTLWEGNVGNWFWQDEIHGNSTHQTLFRNYLHGLNNGSLVDANQHGAMIGLEKGAWWYSCAGNVLGNWWATNHTSSILRQPTAAEWLSASGTYGAIWLLGCKGGNTDAKVGQTIWRYQNYDYYQQSVTNDTAGVTGDLPASLLYSQAPSWWGTNRWPAIEPTNSVALVAEIPAWVRAHTTPARTPSGSTGVATAARANVETLILR